MQLPMQCPTLQQLKYICGSAVLQGLESDPEPHPPSRKAEAAAEPLDKVQLPGDLGK